MNQPELKVRMEINRMYDLARARWLEHLSTASEKLYTQTNIVAEPNQRKWMAFALPEVGCHVKMVLDTMYDLDTHVLNYTCHLHFHWGKLEGLAPEKLVMYSEVSRTNEQETFDDAADHIYNFFIRLKRLQAARKK